MLQKIHQFKFEGKLGFIEAERSLIEEKFRQLQDPLFLLNLPDKSFKVSIANRCKAVISTLNSIEEIDEYCESLEDNGIKNYDKHKYSLFNLFDRPVSLHSEVMRAANDRKLELSKNLSYVKPRRNPPLKHLI